MTHGCHDCGSPNSCECDIFDKIVPTIPDNTVIASLFAIRNHEGLFYKGSYKWTKNMLEGRIYPKRGTAQGVLTSLATTTFKSDPPPDLVELVITKMNVVDQSERLVKAKRRKAEEKERNELRMTKARLQRAQEEFERAQANLEKARRSAR